MSNPYTEAQIRAMSDIKLDDKLTVALGWGDCYSALANYPMSPMPWYIEPWAPVERRRVKFYIGDPPRPWPPCICDDAETAELACEEAGITYDPSVSARVNAENCLVAINAATNLEN